MTAHIRIFPTGANRDTDAGKLDYEGFLSPLVIERFAQYMHKNRSLPDGSLRASDNWQKGIPFDVYIKSMWRHFHETWKTHRGAHDCDRIEEALCGILFNAMGYLHEHLKARTEMQRGCSQTVPRSALEREMDRCWETLQRMQSDERPDDERLVTIQAHDDLHTDCDAAGHGKGQL